MALKSISHPHIFFNPSKTKFGAFWIKQLQQQEMNKQHRNAKRAQTYSRSGKTNFPQTNSLEPLFSKFETSTSRCNIWLSWLIWRINRKRLSHDHSQFCGLSCIINPQRFWDETVPTKCKKLSNSFNFWSVLTCLSSGGSFSHFQKEYANMLIFHTDSGMMYCVILWLALLRV